MTDANKTAEEEGPPTEGVEGPTVAEEVTPSVEAEVVPAAEEVIEEEVATEDASNVERAELAAARAELAAARAEKAANYTEEAVVRAADSAERAEGAAELASAITEAAAADVTVGPQPATTHGPELVEEEKEEEASNIADVPAEPAVSLATKTCAACSVATTLLDAAQCPSCGNPFS